MAAFWYCATNVSISSRASFTIPTTWFTRILSRPHREPVVQCSNHVVDPLNEYGRRIAFLRRPADDKLVTEQAETIPLYFEGGLLTAQVHQMNAGVVDAFVRDHLP